MSEPRPPATFPWIDFYVRAAAHGAFGGRVGGLTPAATPGGRPLAEKLGTVIPVDTPVTGARKA